MSTPRVHHAARRRGGGMAARGARAATDQVADYWIRRVGAADGLRGPMHLCSVCANSAGLRPALLQLNIAGPTAVSSVFKEIAVEFVQRNVDVIVTGQSASPRSSRQPLSSQWCLRWATIRLKAGL